MWRRRTQTPLLIDLTDAALRAAPVPTTCAMCEQQERLFQLVHSSVSLCRACFREMYAPA